MGPFAPHAEVATEEHSRVERGTSCWLAGKCANPNAYMYDAGIAARLADRFRESSAYARASLWVTVKRRFVWVEGCAEPGLDERELEAFVKGVPEVELVLINVRTRPGARLPYTPRPAS